MVRQFALVAFLAVVLDQASKYIARTFLGNPVNLVPSFLSFELVRNTGTSFGLFQNLNLFFLIIGAVFSFGILLWYPKIPKDNLHQAGFAFILGGAVGNTLDRVFLGYVTDFISFSFWPAFNVADSALTIGVVLLLYASFPKRSPVTRKGQMTLFLVLALAVLFAVFYIFFIQGEVTDIRSAGQATERITGTFELTPIKSYVSNCLQNTAEAALRDVAKHGWYLSGEGFELSYPSSSSSAETLNTFNYLTDTDYADKFDEDFGNNLRKVQNKLSTMIEDSIEGCLDFRSFESSNIIITKKGNPRVTILVDGSLPGWSDESVVVKLDFPLSIKRDGFEGRLETFQTTLPVSVVGMLRAALGIVEGIKANQDAIAANPTVPVAYDISVHCSPFAADDVNIEFLSNQVPNPRDGVIRISDYSTRDTFLKKTFQYEFGVRDVYISNECK